MAGVAHTKGVPRFTGAGPRSTALLCFAVAAAYYLSGRLGLLEQVMIAGAKVTPLWPPTGIALTCLLLLGTRIWPGIALGTLLVIASIGPLGLSSLGVIAGNTLAPVCAALMLRRVDFQVQLDRLRDGAALVFLGAFAGMLISATVGSCTLVLDGTLPTSGFWATWSAWWTGDAMGVLVVTPLLLGLLTDRFPHHPARHWWLEPALLLVSTVLVAVLVTRSSVSLLFLVFPLLIWAALRFQLPGAAPCVLLVSVVAVVAAGDHRGPFAHHGIFATMVTLQAFNGCAALTTLLLAAVVAERENTYRKIEDACADLSEVVSRLAPGPPPPS